MAYLSLSVVWYWFLNKACPRLQARLISLFYCLPSRLVALRRRFWPRTEQAWRESYYQGETKRSGLGLWKSFFRSTNSLQTRIDIKKLKKFKLSHTCHHNHNLYFNTIKIKAKKLVGSCIPYRHIDILNKNFRLEYNLNYHYPSQSQLTHPHSS